MIIVNAKFVVVFILEGEVNFEDILDVDVSNVDWWIEEVITLKVVDNIEVEDVADLSLLVEGAVNVGTKVMNKCVDM